MAFDSDLQALTALVEAVRENTTELRLVKIATLETRDLLARFQPPLSTNGHAAQLPLGAATHGHAHAAEPTPPELDDVGNPRVKCVRYECKVHPLYIVRMVRRSDHERLYVSVSCDEYGIGDAYRYALIALKCFKGEEVERNLSLLPKRVRRAVERVLGL